MVGVDVAAKEVGGGLAKGVELLFTRDDKARADVKWALDKVIDSGFAETLEQAKTQASDLVEYLYKKGKEVEKED